MDPELLILAQKGMNPELYAAAQLGEWAVIRRFSGKFLTQRTPKRNTVLHVLAQSCDSADVVQRILARNGSLLTVKNARGETALHLAARKGHSGVVRALIDYSKQNKGCWFCACFVDRCKRMVRMANVDGNTALHEAVKNNFYEVAKLLVQEDPEFRYRPNHAVETPLYLAVEKGYRDTAELILTTCKSPAYLGPGHKTALHAAAIWNLPELMELILQKLPHIIKRVDKFAWTALHYAAKLNHQDVVKLLLSAKRSMAYVAARRDDSKTALHVAVIEGHLGVVQELLSDCPDCWEKCTNKQQNILHLAVKYEQRDVLEFVLYYPWASELINQKDKNGNAPLHLYAATQNLDGKSLVNHPCVDINSFDNLNSTPLDGLVPEDKLSGRQILIRDELRRAGGSPGYRNLATVKKNLRSSKTDEQQERLAGTYLIVATLIATVTFAAGFTVPGGYNSSGGPNQGMAVLGKKAAFITFVISDSLALVISVFAVARLLQFVRRKNARSKLSQLDGIQSDIFTAITLMLIAFVAGLYSVLQILSLKIVMCVLAAFFGFQIPLMYFAVIPKTKTYISTFRNTEADRSLSIGRFGFWCQDLTEAD
ncbi:protein ACCELERATED CELL DEATH 6 [Coffea arabica]|uniref:Protein ACCELERATED CELL DEATH 6 n=1 Tax=Coffea arabica TaxID=13443 RepID=A0A6P6VBR2_COFAR